MFLGIEWQVWVFCILPLVLGLDILLVSVFRKRK